MRLALFFLAMQGSTQASSKIIRSTSCIRFACGRFCSPSLSGPGPAGTRSAWTRTESPAPRNRFKGPAKREKPAAAAGFFSR